MELVNNLKEERSKLAEILPDQVLRNKNTNLFFRSINEGEELLELGDGTGNTFTNIRDLHIIRIVRFQCNCDGSCFQKNQLNQESKIGSDETYSTNRKNPERSLQCCRKIGPLRTIVK